MVVAQAKFTVSVYNNSSTQTPGLLNTGLAGGTAGSYGYYPPISSVTGQGSAVTGPGGLPVGGLGGSLYHGLGHMTNIQVPATIFPNSNFTVVTVFTYSGADVANYSTRITVPGLGVMNNMSQSASVNGGGAATVQNTMATPQVIPYGPVTGTVELIRNGGVLTVDDVQPITINSPGGLGGPPGPFPPGPPPVGSGPQPGSTASPPVPPTGGTPTQLPTVSGSTTTVGGGTSPTPIPTVIPPPSGVPPIPPVPVGTIPPVPPGTIPPPTSFPPSVPPQPPQTIPPPTTVPVPGSAGTITITKGFNASRVTITITGSGFHPGERVLLIFHLDNPGWNWRRWNRHNFAASKTVVVTATAQGQIQHTFATNLHNNVQLGGVIDLNGTSSKRHEHRDWDA